MITHIPTHTYIHTRSSIYTRLHTLTYIHPHPPPPLAAVSCGHLEVVKLLLEHGSDASITDNDRQTALDLYDKEFDPDIEPLLKQYLNTIK